MANKKKQKKQNKKQDVGSQHNMFLKKILQILKSWYKGKKNVFFKYGDYFTLKCFSVWWSTMLCKYLKYLSAGHSDTLL